MILLVSLVVKILACLAGEQPCNQIVKTHSAIELLVSLVTVEAQSYGPKACILMRVVETVPQPGTALPAAAPPTSSSLPPTPLAVAATSAAAGGGITSAIRPSTTVGAVTVPSGLGGGAVSAASAGSNNMTNSVSRPKQPLPMAAQPPVTVNSSAVAPVGQQQPNNQQQQLVIAPRPAGGPPGSQQVQLRVSNDEPHRVFCLSWLKATYELAAGKSIEQNIMYKQYLASMHRMGRKEVISAQHYALCIRTLFGGSTGPYKKQVGERTENHYTGIQVRAQPLPLKLTPAQAAAAHEASRLQAGVGGQQQPIQQQQQPVQQQQQLSQDVSYILLFFSIVKII